VVADMRRQVVDDLVTEHVPARAYADQWDIDGLDARAREIFGLELPFKDWAEEEGVDDADIRERMSEAVTAQMAEKETRYGATTMRAIEKQVLLQTIDQNWREHIVTLEHLRSVVGFRGYAQRDPLNEYKSEGFQLFEGLLNRLRSEVSRLLAHVQVMTQEEQQAMIAEMQARAQAQAQAQQAALAAAQASVRPPAASPRIPAMAGDAAPVHAAGVDPADPGTWGASGRNDPCPCGSGKKYKHCHGRV